jgi:aryl-alcohol dehydrogenase-like predicted oxidoreductase
MSKIASVAGIPASRLALAAHPEQDPRCIQRAFQAGVNFFFFYGPGHARFIAGLAPLVRKHRQEIIVATGSGGRQRRSLLAARRKIVAALGAETIDVFFAEYVNPADDDRTIFGEEGVLAQLQQWKAEGWIRYVGATTHDRNLARRLVEDPRVDLLMHRFNMAHRKAAREVFPAAVASETPIVAFTATRWGSLLEKNPMWPHPPPTAADCYRYCLAQPAVRLVLCAPRSLAELEANLPVMRSRPMTPRQQARWERFGDLVMRSPSKFD